VHHTQAKAPTLPTCWCLQASGADKANQELAAAVKTEVAALMKAKDEAAKAEEM